MGIFELNLTMVVLFLLLAIIPSELYVFGHIFGRSKSYRKALPSRSSSQLGLYFMGRRKDPFPRKKGKDTVEFFHHMTMLRLPAGGTPRITAGVVGWIAGWRRVQHDGKTRRHRH